MNGSDFRGKTVGPVLFETVGIVKIDKKQNPLKSIAENDFSLLQCI